MLRSFFYKKKNYFKQKQCWTTYRYCTKINTTELAERIREMVPIDKGGVFDW